MGFTSAACCLCTQMQFCWYLNQEYELAVDSIHPAIHSAYWIFKTETALMWLVAPHFTFLVATPIPELLVTLVSCHARDSAPTPFDFLANAVACHLRIPSQTFLQDAVQQAFSSITKKTKAENYHTRKWRKLRSSDQTSMDVQKRIAAMCQWRDKVARELDEGEKPRQHS